MLDSTHSCRLVSPDMTAPTLPDFDRMHLSQYSAFTPSNCTFSKNDNGTLTISAFSVFRAGTFKDSMGRQNTWDDSHLQQMVFNYGMLKDNGGLKDVPVREGHPSIFGSSGKVIGYHDSLEVATKDFNGDKTPFLDASFTLTEPDAVGKFERGTYRARSSEIGHFETNNESMYWPVYMGFAFVDIGAVEGLYEHEGPDKKNRTIIVLSDDNKVFAKSTDTKEPAVADDDKNVKPPAFSFTIGGKPVSDFATVQTHITQLEGRNASLEQFQSETLTEGRKAFVNSLATDTKIVAAQVESLTAHALSLSDEQFDGFKASWDAAPKQSLLGVHGKGTTNEDGASGTTEKSVPTELDNVREQVKMHQRANMPQAALEQLPSWKRLQQLEAAAAKNS